METERRLSALIAPVFYPAYHAIKEKTHSDIWLMGGRGSGKSSFASLAIVMGMLRNPQAHAMVYRKVGETLRDSVYPQLIWAIERLGISHLWRYGVSPMELCYLPTGQRILFRGTDNAQKSKGLKISQGFFEYLWFEELTEFQSMQEIRTVKASVIRGGRAVVLYSYNPPQSAMNWVNEEALMHPKGRLTLSSDYRDLPPEWLGQSFLDEAESLRAANEREYRWMYLGEVTGVGGNVFSNVEVRPLAPGEWEHLPAYVGHDFGFATDPDACLRCAYDKRRRTLYLTGERLGTGLSLERLAREITAIAGQEIITADGADPRGIAELRAQGVRIVAARKGPGSVERGLKWLQTLRRIVIDPIKCPHAAREFRAYEYDRGKDGGFLPRYPDRNNHTIDAVRYAMEPVMGRHNAIAVP